MPFVPDAVPEEALDYGEILRRGGANFGDEDFALCKCPHCGRVYLVEFEVDTLFLDPGDLSRRVPTDIASVEFRCEGCGEPFPVCAWVGPNAPAEMQVTWQDLEASGWCWVASR
jgi:hypothetical protein